MQHQQKILDIFEIEELSFDKLIEYYQPKGKQKSLMGLDKMRSVMLSAVNADNRQTKEAKSKGVNMMKALGRREMGTNRERTLGKCTRCGTIGNTTTNYYMSRPCLRKKDF